MLNREEFIKRFEPSIGLFYTGMIWNLIEDGMADIHNLALKYYDDFVKDNEVYLVSLIVKRDEADQWVGYWGAGGGMASVEYVIKEKIENLEPSGTYLDLMNALKEDSYFEPAVAILFKDIMHAMITEIENIKLR